MYSISRESDIGVPEIGCFLYTNTVGGEVRGQIIVDRRPLPNQAEPIEQKLWLAGQAVGHDCHERDQGSASTSKGGNLRCCSTETGQTGVDRKQGRGGDVDGRKPFRGSRPSNAKCAARLEAGPKKT